MKSKKKTKKSTGKAKKASKPKKNNDKKSREGHFLSLGDMVAQNKYGDTVPKVKTTGMDEDAGRPTPLPVSSAGEPTIHWLPKWMRKLFSWNKND